MSDIITKAAEFSAKYKMLPESGLVLAAVSGGSDSVCLMHILRRLSGTVGFSLGVVHFNHCLRGAESDGDELFVRDECRSLGIPFYASRGDAAAYAKEHRLGIEDGARQLRYAFFEKVREETGAVCIATAHNAEDNAETFLMNYVRGAGLSGLCGIPPVRGIYVRPLLEISKSEILSYLSENGLSYREDSTNSEDFCMRNRLRHRVIPLLKELNPGFAASSAVTAELLRQDSEYLSSLADSFIEEWDGSAEKLAQLPFPVSSRVIRKMCPGRLSSRHIDSVLALCSSGDPSASVSLPGLTVRREYGRLVFGEAESVTFSPFTLEVGQTVSIPELGMTVSCSLYNGEPIINKSFKTLLFNFASIYGKILVRPRLTGDSICFSEKSGTKSLKKLFIERHIPEKMRSSVPVISDDNGVLGVFSVGVDIRVQPKTGCPGLKIEFKEII